MSLLAERDFRRIWLAGVVFGVMRWLETLAVGVYVFDVTGSPLTVALMTVARMLPLLLFGPLAGTLAGRLNGKALMAGGLAGLAGVSAVLAVLVLTERLELWHLAAGSFATGMFWAVDFAVRRTILAEVAGTGRMSSAMGFDTATNHATRTLGPGLGGLLLDTVGLAGTFVLGSVLFVIATLLALRLRVGKSAARSADWSVRSNLMEGFRFVRSHRLLLGIVAVTVIFNFFGFAFISVVPVIGREELGLSAFAIGLLLSMEAFGATLTCIAFAVIGPRRNHARIYVTGALVFIVAVLLFSLSPWFGLSLAVLFVGGCGVAGFSVMQSTITYLAAPPEMRARAIGVVVLGIGIGPVGMLHVGFLADIIGASTAVSVIAVEGLIALGAALLIWPELRGGKSGGV